MTSDTNPEDKTKITIICSTLDTASQNIKDHLLAMRDWEKVECPCGGCNEVCSIYNFRNFRIVEIEKYHIYLDGIDKKLEECGLPTKLIIFASKHKSKDGRKLLTVHPTGNFNNADFGGSPGKLSRAAPQAIRSILRTMDILCKNTDYDASMESTHHGPSDLGTPSLYVEIGSNEQEWTDTVAGEIVANSILSLNLEEIPVAIGFGGGHYAPRQSKLIIESDVTFGHNVPNHQLQYIDRDMIKQAFEKSDADFIYFDRKSMSSRERERLTNLIEELGYEILRESDIKEMDGVPWEFCKQMRTDTNRLCPGGRARVTEGLRKQIKMLDPTCNRCGCPKVKASRIDRQLLQEAEVVDKAEVKRFLESHNIAYIERANGTIGHVIFGIGEDCARVASQELANKCIKILKAHYEIEYIPDENILYIIEKKFNPKLAHEMGVSPGPMFGKLANGQAVTINGRAVEPEMVHTTNRRKIILNNIIN